MPDALKTVNLAVPSESSQDAFLFHEEKKWTQAKASSYKFENVHYFDSFEEAVDSVLCGKDEVTFHDESMLLYYLNHEMVKFGQGTYTSPVCDTSKIQVEAKKKRCGLMLAGDLFHSVGYGFAFGTDNPAFIAWSQAILKLNEEKVIAKFLAADQGYDFKIGTAGKELLAADCDSGSNESEFIPAEFYGLVLLCGLVCSMGLLANLLARLLKSRQHTAVAPLGGVSVADGSKTADGTSDEVRPLQVDPEVEAAVKVWYFFSCSYP